MFGSAFAIIIFIALSFWGEKLILIFAKARYVTDDEILINQVKNFCCHSEIPEVKIYWSNVFVNNLYYTNSYFGKPALIIGKNLYKTFSRNELNSLIYASLLKLKSNEAKHRTVASLIFLILYSPVYLLRSAIGHQSIKHGLNVFLYPAYFLKSKLYEKEEIVLSFDQEVGKLDGLRKDYISALFKVNHLPVCSEDSVGGLLMNELNHVKNQTDDVFNYLLIDHVSVETRVKALK
ncbi:MAG: hypothetical protein PHY93_07990 [Bacteriovorax sp.]|nr:hypothetical protein [Bacteriovorax sp.]